MKEKQYVTDEQLGRIMSEYDIRKDEREKVLDDLMAKFDDMNDERFFAYMQELRQKAGE